MIDLGVVNNEVVLSGLTGAIAWNLITWYYGLPVSSSHALIGGYAGAAIAKAGLGAIIPSGWTKTLAFIVISPLMGLILGFFLMVAVRLDVPPMVAFPARPAVPPPPARVGCASTASATVGTTRRKPWASLRESWSPPGS